MPFLSPNQQRQKALKAPHTAKIYKTSKIFIMGKVLIKAKALNELKFTNSSVSTIFQANLAKSVHLSSSVLTENLWHK